MPGRVGFPPQVIDLRSLQASDPVAANVGYWTNEREAGGVDLDGDPFRLQRDEFESGAQSLLAAYPQDPMLRQGLASLQRIFESHPGATGGWQTALAVELRGGQGPGLSRAFGGFTLEPGLATASSGTLRIACPFPTNLAHQTVNGSSLQIRVVDDQGREVGGAVRQRRIMSTGSDGAGKDVLVLEIDRRRLPQPAHLRWEVDVELREAQLDVSRPVPLADLAEIPEEAKPWLQAAPMIQKDDPTIVAMAERARRGAASVQDVVRGTLREIATIRRTDVESWPEDFQNDALSFAKTGWGECTAHANLFAALMRANGIPCRLVNGISRTHFAINMHYQNEVFLPGRGWLHVEPQSDSEQDIRTDMVETGIVSPEMEAQGEGLLHYLGVQELSMVPMEVDENLRPIPRASRTAAIREGLPVVGIPGPGFHGAT